MHEPWFDPNAMAWIPGTVFGVSMGIWGSVVGCIAPQGKARTTALIVTWVLELLALVMLVGGIAALSARQPYGVWYSLFLPGLIGSILTTGMIIMLPKVYQLAEERRMQAKDLIH
jgi:hypothetical protein